MSIINLSVTDTFRTWFNKTNEIIDKLNSGVVADGTTAYGTFILGHNANTSFDLVGSLFVNSSSINAAAILTVHANTVISSDANLFNITSGKTLLQSAQGTFVNGSPLTVNSNATFAAAVAISNTVTVNGAVSIVGGLTIDTANVSSTLNIRNILFGQSNAVFAPAALNNPQYNDYGPAGFDESSIVNLNPTTDVILSGLLAPTGIITGAVVKYIQNIGTSGNKLTISSNNVASSVNNRFKTPNDAPLDVLPGGALVVVWSSTNHQWCVAGGGPVSTLLNSTLAGNTSVSGNISITGLSTLLGNSTFGALTLFVDTTNNLVGVKTSNPTQPLTVNGNVAFVGTFTQAGQSTFSGNTIFNSNTTITGILTLNTVGNTATFGNTITASGVSQSFISNLKANTFVSDVSATLANVSSSGKASLSGTMVIPVGVNKWAV